MTNVNLDSQLITIDYLILAHQGSWMLSSSQRDASSMRSPPDGQRNYRAQCNPKLTHGKLTGQLAQEKASVTFHRQQDETAQPSCLGCFACNWSFPLLAVWPRRALYIATSVSGSPVHFLPTVLSKKTEFTKSLPLPTSVEPEIHIWTAENVI